jgi:hypothetical protein
MTSVVILSKFWKRIQDSVTTGGLSIEISETNLHQENGNAEIILQVCHQGNSARRNLGGGGQHHP